MTGLMCTELRGDGARIETPRSFQNPTSVFTIPEVSVSAAHFLVIPKGYKIFLFCFLKHSINSWAVSHLILLPDETTFPLLRVVNTFRGLALTNTVSSIIRDGVKRDIFEGSSTSTHYKQELQ